MIFIISADHEQRGPTLPLALMIVQSPERRLLATMKHIHYLQTRFELWSILEVTVGLALKISMIYRIPPCRGTPPNGSTYAGGENLRDHACPRCPKD